MTTAGQDVESRFNRALASGAAAAAPAEPGFQQTDLRHVDQLRGRPFFELVEQAA